MGSGLYSLWVNLASWLGTSTAGTFNLLRERERGKGGRAREWESEQKKKTSDYVSHKKENERKGQNGKKKRLDEV